MSPRRPTLLFLLALVPAMPAQAHYYDGVAALERKDYEAARREFAPLGKAGDVDSQRQLYIISDKLAEGLGKQARAERFLAAAANGDPQAQYEAASYFGSADAFNFKEQLRWLEAAAAQGHAGAQMELGRIYTDIRWPKRKPAVAARWYKLAMAQGVEDAACALAVLHEEGDGMPLDAALAEKFYERCHALSERESAVKLSASDNRLFVDGQAAYDREDFAEATRLWKASHTEARAALTAKVDAFKQGKQAYERKDYAAALQAWLPLAQGGEPNSQIWVGSLYEYGQGVSTNLDEAMRWYRLAADQGEAWAKERLATLGPRQAIARGKAAYDTKDYATALQVWLPLALDGNPQAQMWVGHLYEQGYGVTQDLAQAKNWYRKSADGGEEWSRNRLAKLEQAPAKVETTPAPAVVIVSDGPQKRLAEAKAAYDGGDYATAYARWKTLADEDVADAQYWLGQCIYLGRGVRKDSAIAAMWFRKAAEQGHAEAQYQLGKLYKEGDGVPEEENLAIQWLTRAGEQGHVEAQALLGSIYWDTQIYRDIAGLSADYSVALRWLRPAAEKGSAKAQYLMGECFRGGRGVTKDFREAFGWYAKAAEQGLDNAQLAVAQAYLFGQGVDINRDLARPWLEKAAKQGSKSAASYARYLLDKYYR